MRVEGCFGWTISHCVSTWLLCKTAEKPHLKIVQPVLFSVKFGREFPRAAVVHHFYSKSRVLSKVVRGRYNCHQNKNLSSKGRAISQCSPFPSLPQRCSVNFLICTFTFNVVQGNVGENWSLWKHTRLDYPGFIDLNR